MKYGKIIFSHPDVVPASISEEEIPLGENQENEQSYNSGRIFPIYSEMQGIKP